MRIWGLVVMPVVLAVVVQGGETGKPRTTEPDSKAQSQPETKAEGGGPALSLDLGDGIALELVLLPAGKFTMGSPSNDKKGQPGNTPHEVTLTQPFYMGKYEVTQAQYTVVMGRNPSHFKEGVEAPRRPVEMVSWSDAQEFCRRVSLKTGKPVRLPTEAEWEYACRAGTQTRFCSGDAKSDLDGVAWWVSNSGATTHPVGQKKPNAWGLYDMHGNVWEWCQDWYGPLPLTAVKDPTGAANGKDRIIRGGAYRHFPDDCRSAERGWIDPITRNYIFGFRLVAPARTP